MKVLGVNFFLKHSVYTVGVQDHDGINLQLAVTHTGVTVFQNIVKINLFSWAKIRKLCFKRKKFVIKLHPDGVVHCLFVSFSISRRKFWSDFYYQFAYGNGYLFTIWFHFLHKAELLLWYVLYKIHPNFTAVKTIMIWLTEPSRCQKFNGF